MLSSFLGEVGEFYGGNIVYKKAYFKHLSFKNPASVFLSFFNPKIIAHSLEGVVASKNEIQTKPGFYHNFHKSPLLRECRHEIF